MYKLILNPVAGCGTALKRLSDIQKLFDERGLSYAVVESQSVGDATRLAKRMLEENTEGIVAIGGDGTIMDIVNGIAGSDVPLLFAPCGTGNDFIRSLNLPKNPIDALRIQLDSRISKIDIGSVNDLCFANVSGTGFDVDVLRNADRYKDRYSGLIPYLRGLIDSIKTYRPQKAVISVDGEAEEECVFSIISVGNGRYFGGGMKPVPDAIVNDGYFDLVLVKPVPKWAIPVLIGFFIVGKHVRMGYASVRRCKTLRVQCPGMTLNLDGELRNADVAEYRILENGLTVRLPL